MKTRQAKRIRAMRERMEKVATGRVAMANGRVQEVEKRRVALENEMQEIRREAYKAGDASAQELFTAASTLEKARLRLIDLCSKRDEAADVLISLESELFDARRATEMADRLCSQLRRADDARRAKAERELNDDAGSRIAQNARASQKARTEK